MLSGGELLDIAEIGMAPRMLERFRDDALDVPSGVLIVTGPTGSGKTTTLYSCVNHLNDMHTSIVPAEDPVEYVIDGIAQFHTEDSIGGLLRLLNMDIEAFLIPSTVVCVVAQRLLRRVCAQCAQPYTLTTLDLRRLGYDNDTLKGVTFKLGRGCRACRFTGYRGRVGIFELLVLNEMVKDAILNRRTSYEIRRISLETSGLVTLLEDGIVKAAKGETSIPEVLRHLPRLHKPRPIQQLQRLLGELR